MRARKRKKLASLEPLYYPTPGEVGLEALEKSVTVYGKDLGPGDKTGRSIESGPRCRQCGIRGRKFAHRDGERSRRCVICEQGDGEERFKRSQWRESIKRDRERGVSSLRYRCEICQGHAPEGTEWTDGEPICRSCDLGMKMFGRDPEKLRRVILWIKNELED